MDVYLLTTSGSAWPTGYAGVDGWIAAMSVDINEVLSAERPVEIGEDFRGNEWRVLFVSDSHAVPDAPGFTKLGYDAAWLDEETLSVYSLVAHFLLNNRPAGEVGFPLNRHRLFDRQEDAKRLIEEWKRWHPTNPGDKEVLAAGAQLRAFAIYHLEQTK